MIQIRYDPGHKISVCNCVVSISPIGMEELHSILRLTRRTCTAVFAHVHHDTVHAWRNYMGELTIVSQPPVLDFLFGKMGSTNNRIKPIASAIPLTTNVYDGTYMTCFFLLIFFLR